MNVVIVCQSCRKPLKIPAEGLGKKVKCPACQTVFVGQRDEFKPRSATNGETATTTAPAPPTNNAFVSEEDVAAANPNDAFAGVGADSSTPRLTAPAKKKSYLWLIVLLVVVLVGLPVLACAGLAVLGGLGSVLFMSTKDPNQDVGPTMMDSIEVHQKHNAEEKQLPPAPQEQPRIAPLDKDIPK
jgi:LSD1 subclass zinc finger protein